MGDEPHHECGFALLRLLKPIEYYQEKYGSYLYGLNRMYVMMEKQRNRGQDGCGLANVKMDVPPGIKYINCEKSTDKDPIRDVFERTTRMASDKLKKATVQRPRANNTCNQEEQCMDSNWIKENVPFVGELYLAHVRYGTDSDNSIERCHPVIRESNWMTRNLLLAGNFNITNNEDLFASLVQIGQHPRELSDTVTLLEKIGHFVDKENNDLYVKYSASGHEPRTCFSLIAENINVARILRRASADWDGGYCIAGLFGHGDAFCLRDPSGIRPAFYLANDEVVVVASEKPLIQTVFGASEDQVLPLPPGQALVVKRNGMWELERVLPARPLKQCSFERIYFSRGNDAGVYRERERLGCLLIRPLMEMIEARGDSMANTVLSFIPNTSELSFNGLVKEAQEEMDRRRKGAVNQLLLQHGRGEVTKTDFEQLLKHLSAMRVRTEKVVGKDAKIRTFIQEDSSREHLVLHAYDVHYGTIQRGQDVLVALDDSIVRGTTLKTAILRTLDTLGPKRIIIVSSAPQIRFPDVYGIDMAKLGDLAAFRAAITMLQDSGRSHIVEEVYRGCRAQLSQSLSCGEFVNHVKRIYEPFTQEEISAKMTEQLTPPGCQAQVEILFNTVEALHTALPEHSGDWYFTGDYPTPGGMKVASRAFVLWMEGSSERCYGVTSASSCAAKTPVLVVGSGGGSEHALAWKIGQSREVGCVYVAPGNGGTVGHQAISGGYTEPTSVQDAAPLVPVDVPLVPPHFPELKDFCKEREVALVVVSSEQLLSDGLADALRSAGTAVVGPSKAAAELASSAQFAHTFAQRQGVVMEAVVDQAAPQTADVSVSVIAVCDGAGGLVVLPAAVQETRQALGQNQGAVSFGAFAPSLLMTADALAKVEAEIIRPVITGLCTEGRPYVGVLQVELALKPSGPKAMSFRSCINDPTAQAALPLLEGDLFEVLLACAEGALSGKCLRVRPDTSVVAVVMASGGYPGNFKTGFTISGLDRALCVPGAHVFHGSTLIADQVSTPKEVQTKQFRRQSSAFGIQRPAAAHRFTTCGGRVLTVAAAGRGLNEARERAYVGVRAINFTDAVYLPDVAAPTTCLPAHVFDDEVGEHTGSVRPYVREKTQEFTYLDAGVDQSALEAAMHSFQPLLRRTMSSTGGSTGDDVAEGEHSAGLSKSAKGCNAGALLNDGRTMLISTTSTVGTKLHVATLMKRHSTIGIDLVALCANDIAARGARPLFFQQQFCTEKLDAHQAMQLVKGVSDGCVEASCTLLASGVAELPGVFAEGGGDLIGFAVGAVDPAAMLPQLSSLASGDAVIALPSSGLHCNGFSLVRAIIRDAGLEYKQAAPFDPTRSLGEALLPPARIYVKPLLALVQAGILLAATQVSSGGLSRCFDEVLPSHLAAHLNTDAWELPAVLRWLAAVGKVRANEMASTFNCGLGMVLVVAEDKVECALALLREHREEPMVVGKLVQRTAGEGSVEIEGAEGSWLMLPELGVSLPFPDVLSSLHDPWTGTRMRTVVLAGSEEVNPLQQLIQATSVPASAAQLVAVLGCTAASTALTTAKAAGITEVLLDEGHSAELAACARDSADADRGGGPGTAAEDFTSQVQRAMDSVQAELLVVLDDVDIGLLTSSFLSAHRGRVIVVQASLLPSFPGPHAIEEALRYGVCMTGCTVAFVVPPTPHHPGATCYGPQIIQHHLDVMPTDTVATLRERLVRKCELPALPRTVQLVASGAVVLEHGADSGSYISTRRATKDVPQTMRRVRVLS